MHGPDPPWPLELELELEPDTVVMLDDDDEACEPLACVADVPLVGEGSSPPAPPLSAGPSELTEVAHPAASPNAPQHERTTKVRGLIRMGRMDTCAARRRRRRTVRLP
jgi:hypothetical protein